MFQKLHILNIGTPLFRDELRRQGAPAAHVDWKPVAGGNVKVMEALDRLAADERIDRANRIAAEKIMAAHPVWVGMALARDVIAFHKEKMILCAGPPIAYDRMCGPMRGAVLGAVVYEGWAGDLEEAEAYVRRGEVSFGPCHEFGAAGPMAGIVSPTMPVHVVENKAEGNRCFSTVNEGLGKVLRYGANSGDVLDRLCFIRDTFYPAVKEVLKLAGEIDLKGLTAQALHMGDECHNRNKAATSLLIKQLAPVFMGMKTEAAARALEFMCANDHYYLNLSMAACKCSLDAAQGTPHSTVVTTMARNGVDFGIRVAGMPADRWFTGPAQYVRGLFFPGFSEEDANPDIGDSAITETMGIGGFAMAAAPSIVQFVGGTVADALAYSNSMYHITVAENTAFSLPSLDFRGSALGIDIRAVVANGILPIINTGMAHREAGIGQVGAGLVNPPEECFYSAVEAFAGREAQEWLEL